MLTSLFGLIEDFKSVSAAAAEGPLEALNSQDEDEWVVVRAPGWIHLQTEEEVAKARRHAHFQDLCARQHALAEESWLGKIDKVMDEVEEAIYQEACEFDKECREVEEAIYQSACRLEKGCREFVFGSAALQTEPMSERAEQVHGSRTRL
eukprot:TRINITY_DN8414_c0_g1_i1.p1 TRINITY_DN8414_c0_g1~~TRINITY_DN8414_c0_g1_i1.p1  ORF type:complete len:175 (-),score=45.91 TRINITY_DN8414_c0_g1_i1:11-460(-)